MLFSDFLLEDDFVCLNFEDILTKLSGRHKWLCLPPNNLILTLSTVSCLSERSRWKILLSLYLLSSMSIPMRPGTSRDTISMLKTWSKNSIFALPRDGLGLPSPKIYEFSDLLKLCRLPPKLTKVCCPMQLRWAPVSIKKVELPGPVMWNLTVVRPDLLFEFLRLRELDLSDWLRLVLGGCGDLYFFLKSLDLLSERSLRSLGCSLDL